MTRMFGHHIRSELLALYLAEGVAVFLAVFGLLTWAGSEGGWQPLCRMGLVAAILALGSGMISCASGLYLPSTLSRARCLATSTAVATGLLIVIAELALFLLAPTDLHASSTALVGLLVLGAALGVLTARCAHAAALGHGLLRRRLIVIQEAADSAVEDRSLFHDAELADGSIAWLQEVDLARELRTGWLRAHGVWAVVLLGPIAQEQALRQLCMNAGVHVMSKEQFQECRLNRVDYERLPSDWLHSTRAVRQNGLAAVVRRSLDIAIALLLLLLALPLMLAAALIIRIDSDGPVFYRQVRCGLNGRAFNLIKFRSMSVDAERPGVAVWASKSDPRVTRFGRFMRLTRIDELPQLINVLRGDMAMVGPRPERPGFVSQLGEAIPHYNDRASVKPGITGWAQVNYPYGASVEDARMKLAYDLYYVRHCSLFLDLLILVATVRVVLFQEGAR